MTRVAVIGANGQVGSEVCLLLGNYRSVEVVPISRNPTGSAFLRYMGVPCRHGHVADPAEAPHLIGDCDLVLNFAFPVGQPRTARDADRRIIENSVRYSSRGATIVYFSTQCVHRSFRPSGAPPWRSAYGQAKLQSERLHLRASSRHGRAAFVLRLGHVYGELQDMPVKLRELIATGPVEVPAAGERASNIVHTATIMDAVLRIAGGEERPGTYDLVNHPGWTWRQVLAAEAAVVDAELNIASVAGEESGRASPGGTLASALRSGLSGPALRDLGMRVLAHLPESVNERAQARHFRRRAAAETHATGPTGPPGGFAPFTFGPGGGVFLERLSRTEDLLAGPAARIPERDPEATFPPDLAPA